MRACWDAGGACGRRPRAAGRGASGVDPGGTSAQLDILSIRRAAQKRLVVEPAKGDRGFTSKTQDRPVKALRKLQHTHQLTSSKRFARGSRMPSSRAETLCRQARRPFACEERSDHRMGWGTGDVFVDRPLRATCVAPAQALEWWVCTLLRFVVQPARMQTAGASRARDYVCTR